MRLSLIVGTAPLWLPRAAFTAVLLLPLTVVRATGQGGYEFEVYSSETAPRKTLIFELHLNRTLQSAEAQAPCTTGPVVDDSRARFAVSGVAAATDCTTVPPFAQWSGTSRQLTQHQLLFRPLTAPGTDSSAAGFPTHSTLEVAAGLTSWAELGMYLFTTEAAGTGTQWSGGSIRPMVRVPRSWRWPVGIALSTELEYERPASGETTWTLEIRPIFDKALGRWYVSVNPTLEYPLHGTTGVQFSPSAKVSFDATPVITAGAEYYGAYGPVSGFAATDSRLQQIFAAADLHLSPQWEFNLGIGMGVTPASNQLVAKLIVGRRFSWGGDPAIR